MINSTFSENGAESDTSETAYAVIFGCIAAFGLPLNVVALWILIRRHSLKSSSAVFMLNLALSDLLLVISLPTRVYYYATGSSSIGVMACTISSMLFRSNMRSSSILITFIGVDRLLAVVYPLRSRHLRTTSNAWKACSFVWLFLLSINIPEGIEFSRDMYRCNVTICFEGPAGCQIGPYRLALAILVPILALAMLVVNIVSTAMVSWTLYWHVSDSAKIKNKINVMLIFAMNLLMFIVCFLPPSLALLLNKNSKHAIMSTVCLFTANCCLDPLLYYFSMDAFWKKKDDLEICPAGQQYSR